MISKKQIKLLTDIIFKKFKVRKIFLFGSYAYGKPGVQSDLDICIVANFGAKRKIDVIRDIRRELSSSCNISLDILLYDNREFDERAALHNTLEHKILHSGILING